MSPAVCQWGTIERAWIGYRVVVHSSDGTRRDAWAITIQRAARKLVAFTR